MEMPSSSPSESSSAPDASLTCFLVEDSAVIRENLTATLEDVGGVNIVGFAEDEYTALQWLRSADRHCDLMIVDIFLKQGTGLTVLAQARLLQPALKLIVLTNFATADMRSRCLHLGAERVFDKSTEIEELLMYCSAIQNPKQERNG